MASLKARFDVVLMVITAYNFDKLENLGNQHIWRRSRIPLLHEEKDRSISKEIPPNCCHLNLGIKETLQLLFVAPLKDRFDVILMVLQPKISTSSGIYAISAYGGDTRSVSARK